MSKHTLQTRTGLNAWMKPGLARDRERLARVLKRLPEQEREEVHHLLQRVTDFAGAIPEGVEETGRNGYELSLELEAAWLRVSDVGHAKDTWLRPGRLFSVFFWRGHGPFREIDPGWLKNLTEDREEFQLDRERRSLWFHDRAQERVGDIGGRAVREYDPTDTPSYEYIWED